MDACQAATFIGQIHLDPNETVPYFTLIHSCDDRAGNFAYELALYYRESAKAINRELSAPALRPGR